MGYKELQHYKSRALEEDGPCGETPAMRSVPDCETICDALCGFLREHIVAQGVALDADTPLSEMGVDSAALVEILLFLERRFDTAIPDAMLTRRNLESVASLARCAVSLARPPSVRPVGNEPESALS